MTGERSFKEAYEESERTYKALAARVADMELKLDFAARASNAFAVRLAALEQRFAAPRPDPEPAVPFGSIDKLVGQAEQVFDCKSGDYRRAHSVWTGNSETGPGGYVEYVYVRLALIASATLPNAQERLRQAMYRALLKLKQTCKSSRPSLYWRYAVQERIQEETEYDNEVPMRYKISTRIAVPEADYSVVSEIISPDGMPIAHLVQ